MFTDRSRIVAAVSLGLALGLAEAGRADDWPQWLGPNRDGISREKGWRTTFGADGPATLWKTRVGVGYSSLAVRDGRLYTLGNTKDTDTLLCLKAATGRFLWKHTYTCSATAPRTLVKLYSGTRSTPTVAGGRVYSFSRDGRLFCLTAADGKLLWSVDVRKKPIAAKIPSWGFACSPLILDKWVILDAGPIVALEAATGKLVWKSKAYSPAYSSPIALRLGGRPCIATLNGAGLTVVSAADGAGLLSYPFTFTWVESCVTPIVSGGRCFISAGEGSGSALVRLEKDRAVQVWRNSSMLNLSTNSVLFEGHLYGFHGGAIGAKSLRCVALETGEKVWSTRGLRNGALMIADGKLIALGGKGDLVIAPASPAGLKPLTRKKVLSGTCWTVPVLANGRLYCRSAQGELICLDVRAKQPAGSRP